MSLPSSEFSVDVAGSQVPVIPGSPCAETDIYGASRAVVGYCVAEDIHTIVYLDIAGRAIRPGVDEYHRLAHPDEPLPNTYFLSPDGLKAPPFLGQGVLSHVVEGMQQRRAAAALRRSETTLLDHAEQPVLVLDACAHSGDTLARSRELLTLLGFGAVKLGVITDNTGGKGTITPDFSYRTAENPMDCEAFGRDDTLQESRWRIYASPASRFRRRQTARAVADQRTAVRAQVRIGFAADTA